MIWYITYNLTYLNTCILLVWRNSIQNYLWCFLLQSLSYSLYHRLFLSKSNHILTKIRSSFLWNGHTRPIPHFRSWNANSRAISQKKNIKPRLWFVEIFKGYFFFNLVIALPFVVQDLIWGMRQVQQFHRNWILS